MHLATMFIMILRLAFASNATTTAETGQDSGPIRVACIGDSITFGHGIKDREHSSYPARLQLLLGQNYEVRNFGVNGATLINRGTRPYAQQDAFRDALKFQPHVAIIMLGTNDTNKQTWPDHQQDFVADYSQLIKKFQKVSPNVKVWLCLPPPLVRDRGKEWDTDVILNDQVIPKIKSIAKESKSELIDLNSIFDKRSTLLPDGVHPNAEGAKLMARTVYQSLLKNQTPASSNK